MKQEIRALFVAAIREYPRLKTFLNLFIKRNVTYQKMVLQSDFLRQQIYSHYPEQSLAEKRFYNFGAGNQRSIFSFWSYVDLKSDTYDHQGIDVFFDLESKERLPLKDNYAEVIFNSFVIEHISVDATKNLCKEAFRTLKKGGVFHSKIHSYDYGLVLLDNQLVSPKIPFEERESREQVDQFILKWKGEVSSKFIDSTYQIHATKKPSEFISFSPAEAFAYHNITSGIDLLRAESGDLAKTLSELKKNKSNKAFYAELYKNYVDESLKQPYQHNADYFEPAELKIYLENLGFSKVYYTQPYQSASPALWEEKLNPIHYGFLFSIEAVK